MTPPRRGGSSSDYRYIERTHEELLDLNRQLREEAAEAADRCRAGGDSHGGPGVL